MIRSEFGYRDGVLSESPEPFSVPPRFAKHMMVVADVVDGDLDAVADAIEAAWQLQRSADR